MKHFAPNIVFFFLGVICSAIAFHLLNSESTSQYLPQNQTDHSTISDTTSNKVSQIKTAKVNTAQPSNPIPTNHIIHHWQALTTHTFSDEYSLAIYDLSAEDAGNDISNSPELLENVLNKLQTLSLSDQRIFLLQALHNATNDAKASAIYTLIESERSIDRADSVNLIVTLDNKQEQEHLIQQLLQTEQNEEVIQRVVGVLNSEETQQLASTALNDLLFVADSAQNSQTKGLAMRALLKVNPGAPEIMTRTNQMITSGINDEMYEGLVILDLQLNDYGIELDSQQKNNVTRTLTTVANDSQQSIENRLTALSSLKSLQDHY